jgi:hypothetical protein
MTQINLTWRERLADWISGGALTRARNDLDVWSGIAEISTQLAKDRHNLAAHRYQALRDIIAMQTPNMAHIGKRMVKRAQDALEGKI